MNQGCLPLLPRALLLASALAVLWGGLAAWRSPVGFVEGGGPFAIAFGALLGTATAAVGYFALGQWKDLRSHARARRGELPGDGEEASVVGVLEGRTDEELKAPFSGRRALAYRYVVDRWVRSLDGKRGRTLVTAFQGEAMVPCEIRTESGRVALLKRPSLADSGDVVQGDEAYDNARAHFAATFPEPDVPEGQATASRNADAGAERQYEETGGFRIDERLPIPSSSALEDPCDLSQWSLHESIYAPGGTVCATGVWSAERGGLVAPDGKLRELRLEHGNAADASSRRTSNLGCLALGGFVLLLLQVLLALRVWFGGM